MGGGHRALHPVQQLQGSQTRWGRRGRSHGRERAQLHTTCPSNTPHALRMCNRLHNRYGEPPPQLACWFVTNHTSGMAAACLINCRS